MPSQIIRTLLVETDAAESRWIKRTLNPHYTARNSQGIRWQLKLADNIDSAVKLLAKDDFDVILIGVRSHREHIQQRLHALHNAAPRTPVITIVDIEDEKVLNTACGLIATSALHQRGPTLPAAISALVLPGGAHTAGHDIHKLTPRERQILQIIAEGKSTKEVAEHLGISVKTAETHRTNLMRKLGLRSVGQLVRYAIRHEIVEA
jgi:DNA-binding NarL/FixJ family response regulator